jgi:hypothetical protein
MQAALSPMAGRELRKARVALAPPEPASLELFVRRDPPASPLAALSLALTQPTAPDLWFSPGPKILERSA